MSDSITVESIRTARAMNRRWAPAPVARSITAIVICSTTSGPSRRTSFRIVDSSGTRSLSAIRQNRRRCSESETSRTSVS